MQYPAYTFVGAMRVVRPMRPAGTVYYSTETRVVAIPITPPTGAAIAMAITLHTTAAIRWVPERQIGKPRRAGGRGDRRTTSILPSAHGRAGTASGHAVCGRHCVACGLTSSPSPSLTKI